LRRTGLISSWHDRAISPGSEWKGDIDEHLKTADLILLLVSADFVASEYCYEIEMAIALERHDKGDAVVVPIVVRPFDFKDLPFSRLQMLPADLKPVTEWSDRDLAYKDVVQGLRRVIDLLGVRRAAKFRQSTRDGWLNQTRIFDACIAAEIPKDESRAVTAMIRLEQSEGLAFEIAEDIRTSRDEKGRTYSAGVKDIRSAAFTLDFPISDAGVLRPLAVVLKIKAPDFEPPEQEKRVMLPTLRDSQPCSFLLKTKREGEHVLNVELLCDDVTVVEHLLRTRAVHHGGPDSKPPTGGMVILATVPLRVVCVAKAASSSG
jgi:hypothetical protein